MRSLTGAEAKRLARYGVTPEAAKRIWSTQGGECFVCEEPLKIGRGGFRILRPGAGMVPSQGAVFVCAGCHRCVSKYAQYPGAFAVMARLELPRG